MPLAGLTLKARDGEGLEGGERRGGAPGGAAMPISTMRAGARGTTATSASAVRA